jgi:hypothetical protein
MKIIPLLEASAAGKNTHMTHLEDQVLYGGVKGARDAIFALRSLRDMLAGSSETSVDVTVKWDGAPAVFAGVDPSDGKFFVAKKGIFNKNPKVYKSEADIDADTSGDLAKKLKTAFNELKGVGIKGVIQGDIMFTKDDLSEETIDGQKYLTFQPNTIVYAVPSPSEAASEIKAANIGIVFHTTYAGKTFEGMTASYGVNLSSLKKKKTLWMQSASLQNLSGSATLTKSETEAVTQALSRAGVIFQKIAGSTLKEIEEDPALAQSLEQYNNTYVRRGETIPDSKSHVEGLIKWATARFQKDIDSKASEKGKASASAKKEAYLNFFSQKNKENLALVYDLQNAIVAAKSIIIDKLESIKNIGTFLRTKNGFALTGQEGFVAIDRLKGGAVKLVDRLQFSTANFNPDVIKGWER